MARRSLDDLAEEVNAVLSAAPGPLTHQELSNQISDEALRQLRNLVSSKRVAARVVAQPDGPPVLHYSAS